MHLPGPRELLRQAQEVRRDVIRMMRLKFILTAMSILIIVFLIMLTTINMIMQTVSQSQSMRLLEQIAVSDRYDTVAPPELPAGDLPDDLPPPDFPEGEPPDLPEEDPPELPPEDLRPVGNDSPPTFDSGAVIGRQSVSGDPLLEGGFIALSWGEPGQRPQRPGDWEDSRDENWQEPPQRPTFAEPEERPQWTMPPQETMPPPVQPQETAPPPTAALPVTEAPKPVATEKPTERPTQAPAVPTEKEKETETETETETAAPATELPEETRRIPEPRKPRMDRWNVAVTIDHFAIMADGVGNFLGLRNTEDYTEEEAGEILRGILASGRESGMYGWLQFCRAEKPYGTLLVITDKTSDQALLNNLFRLTVVVGVLMLLVLLVILIFLSRMITDPVETAFKRQKQFVSDAGHELKTPIAVLTANADILHDEIGENKWLGYMLEQIDRMNRLVGDLLRLARMDNATQEYSFADFDLSMAVAATTLPFESAAFEQHRNLEMDVQPHVTYYGSEQHIRQLCAIFIDNALKYSNENGTIKVTLLKRGEHCILEFYNTGCEISQAETEKIFERFYRGDKARNNQGKTGYGLGLAIAKSIMEVHKIRFQVTCEQGRWIRFLLTM